MKRERLKVRWTREQLRVLTMGVGAFGLDYLVRNTGRSRAAVNNQILRLFGGGVRRGTVSLRQLAADTGYTERQLQRAGRALGQRWQRTSTHGTYMLSEDQGLALVRWLAHDYWCRTAKTYACVWCGRSDVRPQGIGLCSGCYAAAARRFERAGAPFGQVGLLQVVAAVRARTPDDERDWLDAFEASLREGCVLTRSTLARLHAAVEALGITFANREGDRPGSEGGRST